MEINHRLLKRQLRKAGLDMESLSGSELKFIDAVQNAYRAYEDDREMLGRSMVLSSEELEQSNAELGAILNTFPDVIIRLNRGGFITDIKAGRHKHPFPGYNNPVGIGFFELVNGISEIELEAIIDNVLERKTVGTLEYQLACGGELAFFEVRIIPYDNDHVVGVIRNISDIRKAEAANANLQKQLQLATRMQAVGRLAGGISHDFNNILFSVMGYTQISMRMIGEEHKAHSHLAEVITATQRGKELVEQIMIFSRYKEKKEEPVCLKEVVKTVQKLIKPRLEGVVDLEVNLCEGLASVVGDPSQVNQSILNICTNAVQAMGSRGGKLIVQLDEVEFSDSQPVEGGTVPPGKYNRVAITDNGPGMPESVRVKVFEPFFTTKKVGEGTGLGLSVVLGVMQEHGGGLILDSEVGEGTSFTLFFPSGGVLVESEQVIKKEKLVSGSGRVMVVDDERMLGKMISQMLSYLGYEVSTFHSSLEALESFKNDPDHFDLLMTDQTMPGLTGVEMTKKIKGLKPELPVILCSGYSEEVSSEDANAAGIGSFLRKPITFELLSKEVATALGILEET